MLLIRNKYDIYIKHIEEAVNAKGVRYLKCKKGYHRSRDISAKGRRYDKFDFFSAIHLFGDDELLDETKRRLWEQTVKDPKLKLHVITGDIEVPMLNRMRVPILKCYEYDFVDDKYGTIQKNKQKERYQKIAEQMNEDENDFVLE